MIYSISDIHGDINQCLFLLKKHGIIDDDGNWSAGNSTLVNCGDSTDRGKSGITVLSLFNKLRHQAAAEGGAAIHLMGNHDALILCNALHIKNEDYDPEHAFCWQQNGGKGQEAKYLARSSDLLPFVQQFKAMCRVDGYLFQHVDGFHYYEKIFGDATTPDERIKRANAFFRQKANSPFGCWNMFYDLCDERLWNKDPYHLYDYLYLTGAKQVIHGHTGVWAAEPTIYLDGLAVGIDAIMSNGYRKDEERGCVYVIDSPGTDIVM